ncbi:MAG: nucleotidyltransferase family protein [Phormidesmis sp.]
MGNVMQLKNIELPMAEIERFCQKWKLTELALFGSVLRDDFRADSSDIDVMIQFHPDAYAAFKGFDYFGALDQMEEELKLLFARDVDVIVRSNIEKSPNYLRRHEILSTAQIVYDSSRPSRSA